MSEVTRHFTATTFIVQGDRVLLHLHPKQQLWLPAGGHIERDELPHHAAVREIEEETGLRLRLHSEAEGEALSLAMQCEVVPPPAFILVEDINQYHQHIDFTYFARVPDDETVTVREGFHWIRPDDLPLEGVPENVREGSRRALRYFALLDEQA